MPNSGSFRFSQETPAFLRLRPFEALRAEQELAHLIKDETRFGMAAALTRIVRRLDARLVSGFR
jgi:hypothetical protein